MSTKYHVYQIVNLVSGETKISHQVPRGTRKNNSFRIDTLKSFDSREERVAYLRSIRPPKPPEDRAKRREIIRKAAAISHEKNVGKWAEWGRKGGRERYRRHGLGVMAEFAPYAHKDIPHTEEAKAKISAGNKGKGRYHKRDKEKLALTNCTANSNVTTVI